MESKINSLNNNYILNTIIAIFLVLFASLVAPKLPKSMARILDNMLIRFLIFTGIAFLATRDLVTAIIAVIAVMVSYQTLNVHKITDKVINETKQLIHTQKKNF